MHSRTPSPSSVAAGSAKQTWTAIAAILVILISVVWIWRTEFATKANNVPLNQAVGRVLARQTAQVVGSTGKIILVSMDPSRSPEIKVQMEAFKNELKQLGAIAVKDTVILDPAENPKYRPGSGLSAKRFLKIARKNPDVNAIVSFIGAPRMSDEDLGELTNQPPKLIAETHSPEKLANLFDRKILVAAVVPRFDFPAPGPKNPQTGQQWFDRYYQLLGAASAIPKSDTNP